MREKKDRTLILSLYLFLMVTASNDERNLYTTGGHLWSVCAGPRIIPSVHGMSKGSVDNGEDETDSQKGEQNDPAHPRKGD